MARIGVVSDTHGLLRPEALAYLRGSDFVVHAGDIGTPEVLEALRAVAPVTAVRGNNDHGPWAEKIAHTEVLQVVRACAAQCGPGSPIVNRQGRCGASSLP